MEDETSPRKSISDKMSYNSLPPTNKRYRRQGDWYRVTYVYSPLKAVIMSTIANAKRPTNTRTATLISISSWLAAKRAMDKTVNTTASMRERIPGDVTLVLRWLSRSNSYNKTKRDLRMASNDNVAKCPSLAFARQLLGYRCEGNP